MEALLFLSLFGVYALGARLPHIIHILVDDFGWAEVGYHRKGDTSGEIVTPNIDKLVAEGLELDRHYVHMVCSPSRSAFQTGRHPLYVNVQNVLPEANNPEDPVGGYQGIPINMTGIAEHMQSAGYSTHIVGKWDVGMATPHHSPHSRGYDSWLGYWHHSNDYWSFEADDSKCGTKQLKDLWRSNATFNAPAHELGNGPACTQENQSPSGQRCEYIESLLTYQVKDIISAHNVSIPLFLVWSMHLVHMPLQVPQEYLDKFSFVDDKYRRLMVAMVNYMDTQVGEVITLLRAKGIWDNALIVLHSDNGGEMLDASCGGNNWPLRGGKFSNWEGGIRVNALVSGGMLPDTRRGQVETGYITGWDWYGTYCGLAGVDPFDSKAAKAGLHAVTSYNMWELISGANRTSPRHEIFLADTSSLLPNGDGKALVGGLIQGRYKLLLGPPDRLFMIGQYVRAGQFWPNTTSNLLPPLEVKECGRYHWNGCLFDIHADPYEDHNLANQAGYADVFDSMLEQIDETQKTVYSPKRGDISAVACQVAQGEYDGYWGPFLDLK